jgi:MoaA/NifB/PqqE/SkfB family radical SAM enzyme
MNTCATLLDEPTVGLLKAAGLEIVKASFDAMDRATLRQMRGPEASLEKNIAGIRNAINNGLRVILRLTLCSYNQDQLLDLYHMARDMGAEKLQIKPLVRSGRAVDSKAFLSRDELCRSFFELAGTVTGPIAMPEILCWPSKDTFGLKSKPCASLNKIYFSIKCEAFSCNYLPRKRAIGNLRHDTLERIIHLSEFEKCQGGEGEHILAGCPQSEYFTADVKCP